MFATHKNRRKISVCPNCEQILKPEENFCHNCGQENHDLKIPLGHLIYEFIESIFHFDIKVWETLKTFFSKPGKISKDFNEGKRARYVPPARLYVFISVIFFFLLNYSFDKSFENVLENGLFGDNAVIDVDFPSLEIANDELLGISIRRRAYEGLIVSAIDSIQVKKTLIQSVRDSLSDENNKALMRAYIDSSWSQKAQYRLDHLSEFLTDSIVTTPIDTGYLIKIHYPLLQRKADSLSGVKWLNNEAFLQERADILSDTDKAYARQLLKTIIKLDMGIKFETPQAFKERLSELSHKILKYFSLAMFLLMPIVALFLKLLYFKKTFYYEHFIFSILHHSFAFIWFTILMLIWPFYSGTLIYSFFFLAFAIYLLIALKVNYGQSWLRTSFKYLVLLFAYLFLFNVIATGIFVAGLL